MVDLFDKYIKQISKKLEKAVSKEFREEFLDNLEDQLYSMLDEVKQQEPNINNSDAEVTVLSNCEPVNLVVSRVIQQFRSKDIISSIDQKESVEELRFLRPIESGLLSIAEGFDRWITKLNDLIQKQRTWYLRNENPILTSFGYFILLISSYMIITLILLILPPLYQVTTYPNNKTSYHFFDVPDSIWNNPEITSLSVTPVSSFVFAILIWISTIVIITHIGWNKQTNYALKTGTFLSLILIAISTIMSRDGRLILIKSRLASQTWQGFTQDWYGGYVPTINDYISHFVNLTFLNMYILIITLIFSLILTGSLIKTIIKEPHLPKPLVYSVSRQILKVIIILICFGLMFFIPSNYAEIPKEKDIPIPNTEMLLIYKFEIDWTKKYSSINGSNDYSTFIHEFGYIRFEFYEFFNLSIDTKELGLFTTGSLELLMEEEKSESSNHSFPLLGLLYLPNTFDGRQWQDLIGNEINTTYPFQNFSPTANTTISAINWIINGEQTNISVNTIVYTSMTNNTQFVFSFDQTHGWLMQATLVKPDDDWTQGLGLEILTIYRTFHINVISDADKYYLIDTLLMIPVIISIAGIFSISSLFYYLNRKKINKNLSNEKQ